MGGTLGENCNFAIPWMGGECTNDSGSGLCQPFAHGSGTGGRARDNRAMADTPHPAAGAPGPALSDTELAQLERLLDRIPAPAEPLDVMMLDGYLCGVLLQPRAVPEAQWWRHVVDADGRAIPLGFPDEPLRALVRRRHAELDAAIRERQWFDPWVFELDDAEDPLEAVLPWVAGFATAMEFFPALMRSDSPELAEPLAVLYRCFDPEDLEDADELLALIEELEPPADLAEAVESLVNSVLLLADVSRPLPSTRPARAASPRPRRPGPPSGKPHGPRGRQ
jgi:uncharacterized protein